MFLCKSYKLYFMLFCCKCQKLIKTHRRLGFMSYMFNKAYYSFSFLIELCYAHTHLFCTLQVSLRLVSMSGGAEIPPL